MRSPRWRKVLRDVWLHKARTLLVVLAIAVGIVGAGTVLDTWSLLRVVTREGYLATRPASATVRVDAVDEALLARVRAVPNVAHARARRVVSGGVEAGGRWLTAQLFVAPDLATSPIGKVAAVNGMWPPGDGGLVVESSSVEFSGVTVGDTVLVRLRDGVAVALPVTGIARDQGLAPGWMEHVVYGFITPATLAKLGGPATLDELQLLVREGADDREAIRRTTVAVQAAIAQAGARVTSVDVPVPGRHIHAAQMDSLLFTQGAFGALALVLSGFLVVNLVAAMLAGQVREIGVMKAIGASPGQVAALYLGLALVLGLVASALAIPTAAYIGRRYAEFSGELLNFDTSGFAIPRWAMAVQLVVGVVLPVLAAWIPVRRGCRIPVGEALRDLGIGDAIGSAGGRWVQRVSGVRRPLLLSVRNAFRKRQRMALTLLALAMGGAVFLGSLGLRRSVRGAVGLIYGELYRHDLSLRVASPQPPARLTSAIASVPGVSRVEAWGSVRASLDDGEGLLQASFPVSAPPADTRLVALPVIAGRWLRAGDGRALVVAKGLRVDQPLLEVGREVTLIMRGRAIRWTVVGVVDAGPAPGAWTTREALADALGDSLVSIAMVDAAEGSTASQSELVQRLRDTLERDGIPVETSQLLEANRRVVEDHLLMVAGFLMVMSQLMIVVGGLGLASSMSLAVLERTREIGVLRAIGAPHRAIMAIVQGEGLVIGVLSWVLAIPLSLPMSVILARAFSRIMLPVPVSWMPEPAAVLAWLGVVLVVTVVACAWPAIRATRVTAAAALSYE